MLEFGVVDDILQKFVKKTLVFLQNWLRIMQ